MYVVDKTNTSIKWAETGGAGAREKGYGRREKKEREAGEERAGGGRGKSVRRERKEREAGIFRGREAGDHIDKLRLMKNIINNNFNIIMLFDLYIASKYTKDINVLAKICL